MPPGNQSCFSSQVKFHIKYKMDSDQFESNRDRSFQSKVLEGFILYDLCQFFLNCILPKGISIFLINLDSLLPSPGDKDTKPISVGLPDGMELVLSQSSDVLLFSFGQPLEPLPFGCIK